MSPHMLDRAARIALIAAVVALLAWLAGLGNIADVGIDALILAIVLGATGLLARRQAARGRASDRDFTA